jgi:hypothetical protein
MCCPHTNYWKHCLVGAPPGTAAVLPQTHKIKFKSIHISRCPEAVPEPSTYPLGVTGANDSKQGRRLVLRTQDAGFWEKASNGTFISPKVLEAGLIERHNYLLKLQSNQSPLKGPPSCPQVLIALN